MILGIRQEPGQATISLLAYPLDKTFYPETDKPPLGPATVVWSGRPLSSLFVQGNRITVAGTVFSTVAGDGLRLTARILSPDTCLSAKGFSCQRTIVGCRCNNF